MIVEYDPDTGKIIKTITGNYNVEKNKAIDSDGDIIEIPKQSTSGMKIDTETEELIEDPDYQKVTK